MLQDEKSSQEHPINARVYQGFILGPTHSYYKLMNFLILSLVLLYSLSTHDQASDLWEQLEFLSELKSDIWDTVDWGKKWFVDFNAAKTQFVSFNQSNNTDAIDVKMDGSILDKNHLSRCWGCFFSSKLDWGS